MASSSKSSQTMKNVVIALLSLWSLISLIIIVVWSTSPDLKSIAQCRTKLQDATEKLEGAKVVWNKEKVAMDKQVKEAREEQTRQGAEIRLLLGHLNATNASLEACQQETVELNMNVSVLQENVNQLRQTEANLTAQLRLQEGQIEALQQNLTQAFHHAQACLRLREAAQSQMLAAESEIKACKSQQQYLQKQLQKCKTDTSEATEQKPQKDAPSSSDYSAASPLAGIPALLLLVCSALHLIT